MMRPGIVRADTIDLQDHDAPSAQDHSNVKAAANASDTSSSSTTTEHNLHLASHQAETLRGVAAETAQDRRISWTGSNLSDLNIYGTDLADDIANTLKLSQSLQEPEHEASDMSSHQDNAHAAARNGSLSTNAGDEHISDVDDEELEDEAMDKISSSPSIEDGGSLLDPNTIPVPPVLATGRFSACAACRQANNMLGPAQTGGSLPVVCSCVLARPTQSCLCRQPLSVPENACPLRVFGDSQACKAPDVFPDGISPHQYCHHDGRYSSIDPGAITNNKNVEDDANDGSYKNSENHDIYEATDNTGERVAVQERHACCDADTVFGATGDSGDPGTYLHFTGNSFTTAHEQLGVSEMFMNEMMIPYYNNDSESNGIYESDTDDGDDGTYDGDGTFNTHGTDSRFMVSGWGSECLHNIEDIDFEFVYALHTFMATVEGQANATKGDTMVLLDDSNSYWWLVRVVKDSSIGELVYLLPESMQQSIAYRMLHVWSES
ncbi:protein phosphatase regulator [Sporothrix epigloea]|uniref:Protein phosphatase regulator n=1 Tax=Sporothrix epigloea TaxID=1892477 RepID=A0ABP0DGD7_9PEZI